MHVTDLSGEEYALQATATNNYELNGNQLLSLNILSTKVNKAFIDEITKMWTITDHDDVGHKVVYLKKRGQGDSQNIEVKAIPLFFDDFKRMRIYERYDEHMTANRCFSIVFEDSDYNFVLNGSFTAVQWQGFGEGDTRLDMFKNALNRYGAEFRIVGNTIYIENLIGRDTEFMYRHRLNASNIVLEQDANEFYTFARGYGDYGDGEGGEDWRDANLIREYTSPLAEIAGIGLRHAPPIKNGNITTAETMDEQLQTLVDESFKISLSATIHDLRKQGYAIAQPEMGDRVFLIDERIGLNEEIRVVEMSLVRDWKGNVIDIDLRFGTPDLTKRHQANTQSAISNITDLMAGNIQLPFSVLDNAVAEATKALQRMQSQLGITDNGSLLAVDVEDPNNVVIFNAAGLGVSDNGGSTFDNAITGNGINASVIRTGSMLADRIAGGILESLNGHTHFNLNDGILQMQNTEFRLAGGADIHFLDTGNRLYYQHNDWAGGFGVGTSINDTYNYAFMGVSRGSRPAASDLSDFSGFIANSNDRETIDDIGNSAVGNRFHVRDNAVSFTKGFVFNIDEDVPYFSPMFTGTYDYELGAPNNRWDNVWARNINGSVASMSTHNSKLNIEDIDGRQSFDYFMMMNVKSFFYKEDDYTNRFNARVSPIIEQLDPVLEKLYKANEDSLDINSNLFLLANAFKYFVNEINGRMEVLEHGAT